MQARIKDFCQGRAPREWWPYMGWEWAIFDIRKHRFATFQDVYCHIMPEWCWTTIQETPVSLLWSFCPWDEGTRAFGAGPSVPGVGAHPSAPPLDPRLVWEPPPPHVNSAKLCWLPRTLDQTLEFLGFSKKPWLGRFWLSVEDSWVSLSCLSCLESISIAWAWNSWSK